MTQPGCTLCKTAQRIPRTVHTSASGAHSSNQWPPGIRRRVCQSQYVGIEKPRSGESEAHESIRHFARFGGPLLVVAGE